jgi:hypothetical protein
LLLRRDFITRVGLVATAGALAPMLGRAGDASRLEGARQMAPPELGQIDDWSDADQARLAPPPHPFVSNHNYFITGDGKPILGLKVTIDVLEDIVAPGAMSFQLNASSPADAKCVYQQYCTALDPKWGDSLGIGWSIENFPSKAFRWKLHSDVGLPCNGGTDEATCKGNLYNYPPKKGPFYTASGPSDRIPAGYKIKYELMDGPEGAIIGAKYSVVDNHGRETSTGPIAIHKFDFAGTSKLVGPDGVAPNMAFQLNMCGLHGGQHTELQSGGGTITYEATTPLTPMASTASLTNVYQGVSTVESSNLVYSRLLAGPQQKIVQKFGLPRTAGQAQQGGRAAGDTDCPRGQTYNSLAKQCEVGGGRAITYDQAPPRKPQ